jgi:hypothetical protein
VRAGGARALEPDEQHAVGDFHVLGGGLVQRLGQPVLDRDRILRIGDVHDVHARVAEVGDVGVIAVAPHVGVGAFVSVPRADQVGVLRIVLGDGGHRRREGRKHENGQGREAHGEAP